MKKKVYGFKPPVITENDYVAGDGRILGSLALNPTGDWTEYLPIYEAQADKYETWACTVFGLQNQVEILSKYLYKNEPNYSERYNYNLAKIGRGGTDPQISYETARKYGLIGSEFLPVPDTYEEYCTPRPMTEEFLAKGKIWLSQFIFDHDWILTGYETEAQRVAEIRKTLTECPIGVSVTAWFEENGVYVDRDVPNNHWCVLFRDNTVKRTFSVFDSYDHSIKDIPYSHKISYAKRITLSKKNVTEQKLSLIESIIAKAREAVNIIIQAFIMEKDEKPVESVEPTLSEKLLMVARSYVGTDASPSDLAPDELGCAESVNNIFKETFGVPICKSNPLSTYWMYKELKNKDRFDVVLKAEPGDIIISPTGYGLSYGTIKNGHVGIVDNEETILSNNSKDGKWDYTYTLVSWNERYKIKGGYPVVFFRVKKP